MYRRLALILLLMLPQVAFAYLPCRRLQLYGWWGSGEYMSVWRKKREYPPLVSNGIIGDPDVAILFGDEALRDSPKSGGRGDFGFWLTPCLGLGTGFFALGDEKLDFTISGDATGNPLFGRPFTDVSEPAYLVISEPGTAMSGLIDIDANNRIWGSDCYVRYSMLASCRFKLDLIGGFKMTQIVDNLNISTDSTGVDEGAPNVHVADHFDVKNDYYAGLVGFMSELRSQCWAVYVTGKVGIGNMVQKVDITGQTITTQVEGGQTFSDVGFLAASSNIGEHSRNHFEVVPELNAQLQLRLCPHFWVTAGYTYMFWPKILMAGDQVDLNVDPFGSLPIPAFVPHETTFWAQGFTTGFYFLF